MQQHRLLVWAGTDIGRRRTHNEDYYLADPEYGLYAVADGMGGYEAGEVASRMTLEYLQESLQRRKDLFHIAGSDATSEQHRQEVRYYLDQCVQNISNEILTLAQKQGNDVRMGTTLCALVTLGNVAAVVHVGDSRCYLWRAENLYQLTEDHSLVMEQLKMGLITQEEAARSRYRNVITRAVGLADRLQVDIFFIDLLAGDRFVLCSDGLHGYFGGDELGEILSAGTLETSPQRLIDFANESGGKDNITSVVVAVEGTQEANDQATEITAGIDVLSNNPLFQGMTYPEILKIFPLTSQREFQAGEYMVREGEPANQMFIVQEGRLSVYRSEEFIAQLGPGDYVGEMGVFDGEPYSATVVSDIPTRCMTIEREDLSQILRQKPDLGYKIQQGLINVLCKRLRQTSNELAWTRREWRRSVPQTPS